jgi:hypothetical protein
MKRSFLAALFFWFCNAQAGTINFDALQPFNNYAYVPDGYGSTADVSVTYQTLWTDGSLANSHAMLWNAGFANLNTVVFADNPVTLLEITLTAVNPNSMVLLNSFDVGAYFDTNASYKAPRPASDLRVVDGNNNVLINYVPFSVPFDIAQTLMPNVAANSLSIILGTDWNNGINNISFDTTSVSAVPLPPALWLFGSASLMGLGLLRKKAQKEDSV